MNQIKRGPYVYEYEMLNDMNALENLEMLKTHIMYSDLYESLPKERQVEIYNYCRYHATHPVILKNLEQIRYAVTRLYFAE